MIKNFLALFLIAQSVSVQAETITLEYPEWTIWYNCEKRGYDAFMYTALPDSGNFKRPSSFHDDDGLPEHCQQFSTNTYNRPDDLPEQFDRGHGVPANHWDGDKDLIYRTNSMANVVPHSAKLNRHGVWRKTDKIVECHRDSGPIRVWGGVVWGTDTSNDYFVSTHGVVTPDFLWKVIQVDSGEVYAWLMPNDDTPKAGKINNYLVSPEEIERVSGFSFPDLGGELQEVDTTSIKQPKGCDLS